MANFVAGSGLYSHEVPSEPGRVVRMRDGNTLGGEVYRTEEGAFRFVNLDAKELDTVERCVLVRLTDVDANAITGVWLCDLDTPDGMALLGRAAGDDVEGEVLWDSED